MLNKPAGIAVHGGSGMSHGVIEALRAARPDCAELDLVHRLDRETSGCLLVAKRRSALRDLHAQLREGTTEKLYLALVCGTWNLGHKRIELALATGERRSGERHVAVRSHGQMAVSTFRPVQFFGNVASLMEVAIDTGKTHQIRVHAAYAGHPVAGDDKYGDREKNAVLRAVRAEPHVPARGVDRREPARHARTAARERAARATTCGPCSTHSSRHRDPRAAQRAAEPDQRQAGEAGRVGRFDAFEKRDAERLGLEAAGAIERGVGRHVALDLGPAPGCGTARPCDRRVTRCGRRPVEHEARPSGTRPRGPKTAAAAGRSARRVPGLPSASAPRTATWSEPMTTAPGWAAATASAFSRASRSASACGASSCSAVSSTLRSDAFERHAQPLEQRATVPRGGGEDEAGAGYGAHARNHRALVLEKQGFKLATF